MLYEEADIVFTRLDGDGFEELCFDLLVRVGFHGLTWRQGGADSGRDIEARLTVHNPLLGPCVERWFIECKNHAAGVRVSDLDTKIAWARAKRPDHLLIVTSSYLTKDTREWLDGVKTDLRATVHVLEGKELKRILTRYPDLVTRHLIRGDTRLLHDVIRMWRLHGSLPSPETLLRLNGSIDPEKLDPHELAFLWNAFFATAETIAQWLEIEENEEFSFEDLEGYVLAAANASNSVLGKVVLRDWGSQSAGGIHWMKKYGIYAQARLYTERDGQAVPAVYTFVKDGVDSGSAGIEVLIEGGADLRYWVRHMKRRTTEQFGAAMEELARLALGLKTNG